MPTKDDVEKWSRKADRLAACLADPLRFVSFCWPDIRLYDKQAEVLLSVRDNVETFVHAGNELGKDFISSIVALWFFASRRPARVILTSSSNDQLEGVLWAEIRQRLATSRVSFPFEVDHLRIRRMKSPSGRPYAGLRVFGKYDGIHDPLSYVIGKVARKGESFAGFHLPNKDSDRPRVLAIFDEASGIPDEFYEAADAWADRKLVIGNPLNTTNFFFRCCKAGNQEDVAGGGGLLRKVIHISGEDSPNVRLAKAEIEAGKTPSHKIIVPGVLSYSDYLRRKSKWDKVRLTTRLYGHFYEGEEQLLYPPDWLDRAEDLWFPELANEHVEAMGIDTGAGRDLSCWALVCRKGLIRLIAKPTPDTTAITGRTIKLMQEYRIKPTRVFIDAGGGGKQIADRLREQGYHVKTVFFGSAASKFRRLRSATARADEREGRQIYKNKRAEMYGKLRMLLDPSSGEGGFAISPEEVELRQELSIFPLLYDSEGKMFLPPKDHGGMDQTTATKRVTIRDLLGHSPDRSDALVLAVEALLSGRSFYGMGVF